MITNETINKGIAEARKVLMKYDTYLGRSGDYSALLRTLEGGRSAYEELQHSEVVIHFGRQRWEECYTAFQASKANVEGVRKLLVIMGKAGVSIADAEGKTGLRDFLIADANDEASFASRLAEAMKDVRFVGPGFSQAFATLREELIAHEAAHQEVAQAFDTATRELGQAFYKATAVLAQAKALLFASGIKVTDKKAPKKKKKAPVITDTTPVLVPAPSSAVA